MLYVQRTPESVRTVSQAVQSGDARVYLGFPCGNVGGGIAATGVTNTTLSLTDFH